MYLRVEYPNRYITMTSEDAHGWEARDALERRDAMAM